MKRKLKYISILVAILFVAGGLVGWQYRWSSLDTYLPTTKISFDAPMRTMAEHDEFMSDREWPYTLELDELYYFGSYHTNDPDDAQIADIVAAWDRFQPTVALLESRLGFYVGGLRGGVGMFGEVGAGYALARRDDIPAYSLEPSWEVEVQAMLDAFPPEEVLLFYMLRVFISERDGGGDGDVDALASHLLRKRASRPGLDGIFDDLAALDRYWSEHFADEYGDWRELPARALWPSRAQKRPNQWATLSNELRDEHMTRVIIDLVRRGERVFVICGGSHLVKQEPTLRAGL